MSLEGLHRPRRSRSLALAVLAAALATGTTLAARKTTTVRVSVSPSGAQTSSAYDPAMSGNGRAVAFSSDAGNVVPGDSNHKIDVFVRDLDARTTQRVSVSTGGAQANQDSGSTSLARDRRLIAFSSLADNLVSDDTNGRNDVFVRDLRAQTTTRVSVNSAGAQEDDDSGDPSFARGGRFVAFTSFATNLVPGDSNRAGDVFLRDLVSQTTQRVSVNSSGAQANSDSISPSLSAKGQRAAFISDATNLVPGDTNRKVDVFVRDLATLKTRRVSVSSTGIQGNGDSNAPRGDRAPAPAISDNGRFVAFYSRASNLVTGDTNRKADVFVHDLATLRTRRVSVSSRGTQGNGDSNTNKFFGAHSLALSSTGRYVAFWSIASNLVSRDTNRREDVFVHDLKTHTTKRVSVGSSGSQANSSSIDATLSADGRFVGFISIATNLVPHDTNRDYDVFVRGPLR